MGTIISFLFYIGFMLLNIFLSNSNSLIIQNLSIIFLVIASISLMIGNFSFYAQKREYLDEYTPTFIISFFTYIITIILVYLDVFNNIFFSDNIYRILISFNITSFLLLSHLIYCNLTQINDSTAKEYPNMFFSISTIFAVVAVLFSIHILNVSQLIILTISAIINIGIILMLMLTFIKSLVEYKHFIQMN